jgi:trk system potassium uptake protein
MKGTINRFREKFNLNIYESQARIMLIIRILSTTLCLLSVGSILYHYGFNPTKTGEELSFLIIQAAFAVFIFKFLLKIFYDLHVKQFLEENRLEAFLIFFLLVNYIILAIFGNDFYDKILIYLKLHSLLQYKLFLIHCYTLLIIIIEIGKGSQYLSKLNISPGALLIYSFIFLIFTGSGLLMVPEMTYQHHYKVPVVNVDNAQDEGSILYSTSNESDTMAIAEEQTVIYKDSVSSFKYIDALFTSTSACCVTGLTSVETVNVFTTKGRIVIMLLIQLGGLSIIAFASFFTSFVARNQGIKYQAIMRDFFNAEKISDTYTLLRRIIYFSIAIEVIGSLAIFLSWRDSLDGYPLEQRIFYSIFHSISSFNNAGFALFYNNLYNDAVKHNYLLHTIIMVLIILGGIGFAVMEEIYLKFKMRYSKNKTYKRYSVGTKIVLFSSLILILVGAIGIFILERNNALAEFDLQGKIVASFFQSISTRTCGFNTIDFRYLSPATLMLMIALMYIGASPGSTGGGIKTTTFVVIIKSAVAIIRGEKSINIFKHSISHEIVFRSYVLAFFSIMLIIISLFFLSFTQSDFDFLKALFEEVSAFGTVGLSTGITPALTDSSKIIIITTMFIGRVGPLTLAMLLRKSTVPKIMYPNANMMIG